MYPTYIFHSDDRATDLALGFDSSDGNHDLDYDCDSSVDAHANEIESDDDGNENESASDESERENENEIWMHGHPSLVRRTSNEEAPAFRAVNVDFLAPSPYHRPG